MLYNNWKNHFKQVFNDLQKIVNTIKSHFQTLENTFNPLIPKGLKWPWRKA